MKASLYGEGYGLVCAGSEALDRATSERQDRWHHGRVKLLALIGIALVGGGAAKPALRRSISTR